MRRRRPDLAAGRPVSLVAADLSAGPFLGAGRYRNQRVLQIDRYATVFLAFIDIVSAEIISLFFGDFFQPYFTYCIRGIASGNPSGKRIYPS